MMRIYSSSMRVIDLFLCEVSPLVMNMRDGRMRERHEEWWP
jgi:hypothetical protein